MKRNIALMAVVSVMFVLGCVSGHAQTAPQTTGTEQSFEQDRRLAVEGVTGTSYTGSITIRSEIAGVLLVDGANNGKTYPAAQSVTVQQGQRVGAFIEPEPADLVRIQGGTFMMGSPANEAGRWDNEGPQHQVTVSGFYMSKTEVSVGDFRRYVQATGYKTDAESSGGAYVWTDDDWVMKADANWKNPYFTQTENSPVTCVSWNDAVNYCNWKSRQEGLTPAYTISGTNVKWNLNANGYRLPTEAEWEYACRAGTTTPFSTGNNITASQANYDGNYPYNGNAEGTYREKTTPVGSFAPNSWGLYDMHGNVWEWCWDWYDAYSSANQTDPMGAVSVSSRVYRGGGWIGSAALLRSAKRNCIVPTDCDNNLGFRVVRPAVTTSPVQTVSLCETAKSTGAADTGSIAVRPEIAAVVFIDGGTTGLRVKDGNTALVENAAIGATTVAVRSADGKTYPAAQSVTVQQGQRVGAFIEPEPADLVRIQGGTFTMGSPADEAGRDSDEGPQHQVTVSGFSIGKYEVTVANFRAFVQATGYKTEAESSGGAYVWTDDDWVMKADANWKNPYFTQTKNSPVTCVSWNDAVNYCNWKSRQEGLTPAYTISGTNVSWNRSANGYRLPTEAEWEYACRAGTTTLFSTGNNITTSQANYDGNDPYNGNAEGTYREKTTPVGSFAPNNWGLYDMHGNVWEWCWDWKGGYSGGSQTDPIGAASGSYRVYRGGGWGSNAAFLRSANRSDNTPASRDFNLGFRVVRP
ncbi:formylglycine-generating enzyme family protein [Breznakiellaceae bacterium SP9]